MRQYREKDKSTIKPSSENPNKIKSRFQKSTRCRRDNGSNANFVTIQMLEKVNQTPNYNNTNAYQDSEETKNLEANFPNLSNQRLKQEI